MLKALQHPDTKKRMLDSGIVAIWSTPDQFLAFQKAEIQKWAKVIKDANIRMSSGRGADARSRPLLPAGEKDGMTGAQARKAR